MHLLFGVGRSSPRIELAVDQVIAKEKGTENRPYAPPVTAKKKDSKGKTENQGAVRGPLLEDLEPAFLFSGCSGARAAS
jgi:hypothetical protein